MFDVFWFKGIWVSPRDFSVTLMAKMLLLQFFRGKIYNNAESNKNELFDYRGLMSRWQPCSCNDKKLDISYLFRPRGALRGFLISLGPKLWPISVEFRRHSSALLPLKYVLEVFFIKNNLLLFINENCYHF